MTILKNYLKKEKRKPENSKRKNFKNQKKKLIKNTEILFSEKY